MCCRSSLGGMGPAVGESERSRRPQTLGAFGFCDDNPRYIQNRSPYPEKGAIEPSVTQYMDSSTPSDSLALPGCSHHELAR